MGTEMEAVVRAVVADCLLDCRHVEIAADKRVRHIPWGVHDLTEDIHTYIHSTFPERRCSSGSHDGTLSSGTLRRAVW
jgi:hypothetical protein